MPRPVLACPRCVAPLGSCGCRYPEEDGIPDLYLPATEAGEQAAVTRVVRDFYDAHPFPDYRSEDDLGALVRAGRANAFTRELDEAIPPDATVVEIGCGTGQLALFLGVVGRAVIGIDLSLASLRAAERLRRSSALGNVTFARGNLFRPPLLPGSADVVICTGVLHHTGAPRKGLHVLASLCRPGGYLVVGLYNRYGRILLPLLRRAHARAAGPRGAAWFHDQHHHPQESRHTAGEVFRWLDEASLAFVSAIPPLRLGAVPGPMFAPAPPGTPLGRLLAQLSWVMRAADGGLWITVARKPAHGLPGRAAPELRGSQGGG